MKKLAFILITILSLALVACTMPPLSKIDQHLNQLSLTYATGDSSDSVTTNFSLPSSIGEATITWESSDTTVISIVGSIAQVTRGETDASVTLTAELTLDDETKDKIFNLTVKALEVNETYYTITWVIDGLETTTSVLENTLPSHVDPTKEGYVFVGWDPAIVAATADVTYTAVFEPEEVNTPDEIDGAALDLLVGASIYQLLPQILSGEYELVDVSSEDYPVDIYIDLFDWDETQFLAYQTVLDSLLSFDDNEGAYVVGDFFITIYLDEDTYETPVYSINIYNLPDSDTNPDPVEEGEIVVTSKYGNPGPETIIPQGNINSHLTIVTDGPALTVTYAKNAASTETLFFNQAGQIRLYPGNSNGTLLTFEIAAGYKITSVSVVTGLNNGGLSINGDTADTTKSGTITAEFVGGLQTVTLKNVANAPSGGEFRIDIVSITFTYVSGSVAPLTWATALDSLESHLSVGALDVLFPEIPNLTDLAVVSSNGGFNLSATAASSGANIVSGYVTTLLAEGWTLSDVANTYVYPISESVSLKLVPTSNGNNINLWVAKFSTVTGDEIDGALVDQYAGEAIYQLLPPIVSSDYDIFDESSDMYPVDIYIDLYDWTEDDALAYEDAIDAVLEYDDFEEAYMVGLFYIVVYLEEELYDDPVYSINIYTYEGGGNTDPDTEFDGAELDQLLGASIYDLLPVIVSFDYEFFDESSEDYPIDIFIDLFDWTEEDAVAYEDAIDASLEYDDVEGAWVVGGFFIYVYIDDINYETPVFGINIYSTVDSTDPEIPGETDEITVTSKYSSANTNNIPDGNINSHLNFTTGPVITVTLANNGASTLSIFNNGRGEVRLYPQNGHGTLLTFELASGFNFTGVSIVIGTDNGGLSINGSPANTTKSGTITANFAATQTVTLKNVAMATSGSRIDIKSITFFYIGGSTTIETWSDATDALETKLNVGSLDTAFPEIPDLTDFTVVAANGGFNLSATALTAGADIITGYITSLLGEGWTYDEELEAYIYEVSETINLKLVLSSDGNNITLWVAKFYNLVDADLETLPNMKSITDMELEKFGKSGLPSVGTYNVLVIPVEIQGAPFPVDYLTQLDLLFNGNEVQTGWESVASYYQQSSFGQLNLTFDIHQTKYTTAQSKSTHDSNERADYDIVEETLAALENQIDFTQYDFNDDGVVDSIIFVYSADYNATDDESPWWAWVTTFDESNVVDGMGVEYYMWVSYTFMEDTIPGSSVILNAETYIHELGHLLGYPDLYSSTHDYSPLGGWDMMDYNVGDHGPANKLLFGWLKPLLATEGMYQVTLDSLTLDTDGEQSALLIPYSSSNLNDGDAFDEYLLVVFYTPGGLYDAHYNTNLGVEDAGVVIYHVDARLNSSFGFWDWYFQFDTDGVSDLFTSILEADHNNSIPGNSSISQSDLLTSGSINLGTYYNWNQGGKIDVTIEIASSFNNDSESITLTVTVN